eukprot:1162096-Pelagomonas_calceolata.AAC.7
MLLCPCCCSDAQSCCVLAIVLGWQHAELLCLGNCVGVATRRAAVLQQLCVGVATRRAAVSWQLCWGDNMQSVLRLLLYRMEVSSCPLCVRCVSFSLNSPAQTPVCSGLCYTTFGVPAKHGPYK